MAEAALTDTDKMIAAAEKFGDKLAQLATQYGPDVADVALLAARVDAASTLVTGAVCVISSACVAYFIAYRATVEVNEASDGSVPEIIPAIVGTFVAAGFAFAGIPRLTSVWAWVGIFEPKVWLAGKLLGWL
jgi:hypothetical protein